MKQLIFLWLISATAAWANTAPKIEFDRMVYDFGATSMVDSVTGTFTFTNTGNDVLKLNKPKPSCGCTVAQLSSDTLKPGEKGQLVFTIKLGPSGQKIAKEISVPSNDPLQPLVVLAVKVAVQSVFVAQPPGVSFAPMHLGMTTNTTLLVTRTDGKPLIISRLDATSDLISTTVEPTQDPDGRTARIRFEVKADGLPRLFSEQVRAYTPDSIGPAFAIFVRARFLGDITLQPQELDWGMPDPDHWSDPDAEPTLSGSILVTTTQTNRPFLVRHVTCNLKEFQMELVTVVTGEQYRVVATLPERLKQSVSGTISFETNLPTFPKVDVPLSVHVWKDQ